MRLRSWQARAWTGSTALAGVLCALAVHGCNATSGGIISYMPVAIGGAARDAGGPMVFTTQYFRTNSSAEGQCGTTAFGWVCGWDVELTQAVLSVGPFYFYTSPPGVQNEQTGTAILQITSQQFVDVLDPTLYSLDAGASGQTGDAVSVDVFLLPPGYTTGQPGNPNGGDTPPPADSPQLAAYESLLSIPVPNPDAGFEQLKESVDIPALAGASSAFVAGTATATQVTMLDGGLMDAGFGDFYTLDGGLVDAGQVIIPFYGFLTIDNTVGGDANDAAVAPLVSLQQVPGAAPCVEGDAGGCSLSFTTQPSVLQIRIDPTHWFDDLDFSTLVTTYGPGGWALDSGVSLTWNWYDNAANVDGTPNTFLWTGLQATSGVYLFSVVPEGSN
jgi:hypothetical protein